MNILNATIPLLFIFTVLFAGDAVTQDTTEDLFSKIPSCAILKQADAKKMSTEEIVKVLNPCMRDVSDLYTGVYVQIRSNTENLKDDSLMLSVQQDDNAVAANEIKAALEGRNSYFLGKPVYMEVLDYNADIVTGSGPQKTVTPAVDSSTKTAAQSDTGVVTITAQPADTTVPEKQEQIVSQDGDDELLQYEACSFSPANNLKQAVTAVRSCIIAVSENTLEKSGGMYGVAANISAGDEGVLVSVQGRTVLNDSGEVVRDPEYYAYLMTIRSALQARAGSLGFAVDLIIE